MVGRFIHGRRCIDMTREELISTREKLIEHSGMSWKKLQSLGESFQLDDDNYNTYRSVKAIDWVLWGK